MAGMTPSAVIASVMASVGEGLAPSRAPARGTPTANRSAAERVLNTLIDARLLTSYEVPAADEGGTAAPCLP